MECLPHDRRFAIALGSTRFDPEHPEWLPKTDFIMLMRDEKLAQSQTHFDVESGVLAVAKLTLFDHRSAIMHQMVASEAARPGLFR